MWLGTVLEFVTCGLVQKGCIEQHCAKYLSVGLHHTIDVRSEAGQDVFVLGPWQMVEYCLSYGCMETHETTKSQKWFKSCLFCEPWMMTTSLRRTSVGRSINSSTNESRRSCRNASFARRRMQPPSKH